MPGAEGNLVCPVQECQHPVVKRCRDCPGQPRHDQGHIQSLPNKLLVDRYEFSHVHRIGLELVHQDENPAPLSAQLSRQLGQLELLRLGLLDIPAELQAHLKAKRPKAASRDARRHVAHKVGSRILDLLDNSRKHALGDNCRSCNHKSQLGRPLGKLPEQHRLAASALAKQHRGALFATRGSLEPLAQTLEHPFPANQT